MFALNYGNSVSWQADEDCTLTRVINHGGFNGILHLDPDLTYADWVAGLATGVKTDFVLYCPISLNAVPVFQPHENLLFQLLKGQLVFFSPEGTAIAQLFLLENRSIFS